RGRQNHAGGLARVGAGRLAVGVSRLHRRVSLLDVEGAELVELHAPEDRNEVVLDELPVPLTSCNADSFLCGIGQPAPEVRASRDALRIDQPARVVLGLELAELLRDVRLRLAVHALADVLPVTVETEGHTRFPQTIGSLTDVALAPTPARLLHFAL